MHQEELDLIEVELIGRQRLAQAAADQAEAEARLVICQAVPNTAVHPMISALIVLTHAACGCSD